MAGFYTYFSVQSPRPVIDAFRKQKSPLFAPDSASRQTAAPAPASQVPQMELLSFLGARMAEIDPWRTGDKDKRLWKRVNVRQFGGETKSEAKQDRSKKDPTEERPLCTQQQRTEISPSRPDYRLAHPKFLPVRPVSGISVQRSSSRTRFSCTLHERTSTNLW